MIQQPQQKKNETKKFTKEQNEIFEITKKALFESLEEFKISKELIDENKMKEIIQIFPGRDEKKGNFYTSL